MRDRGTHGCKGALAFVVRGWGYPLRFIGGTEMDPKPPPFHLCVAPRACSIYTWVDDPAQVAAAFQISENRFMQILRALN